MNLGLSFRAQAHKMNLTNEQPNHARIYNDIKLNTTTTTLNAVASPAPLNVERVHNEDQIERGHPPNVLAVFPATTTTLHHKAEEVTRATDDSANYEEAIDSFDEMGLPEPLLRGIYAYGFEKPSAIQSRAIRPSMLGKDLIAQAQSGKLLRVPRVLFSSLSTPGIVAIPRVLNGVGYGN